MMDKIVMLFWGLIGFSILCMVIQFVRLEIQNYKNSHAPIRTERALVYYKDETQDILPQGRTSGYVFYITFHTDFGEIVRCYMDYDHFYIIEEGAFGELTWQGQRLIKFTPEQPCMKI